MKLRTSIRHTILVGLLALAFLAVDAGFAIAQQAPVASTNSARLSVTKEEARSLAKALTVLAKQAGVVFVVEGVPLQPTLTEEQIKDIAETESPVSDLVTKLAAAYDYEAKHQSQSRFFLLKKRYSDPRDLPAVTLEECRLALQDVRRVLARHNPRVSNDPSPKDPVVGELMLSLSQEHLRRMRGKRQGSGVVSPTPRELAMPLSALDARQRGLVWRFATYYYVQRRAEEAEITAGEIDTLLQHGAVFCWAEREGRRFFGYETPITAKGAPPGAVRFWPLNLPSGAANLELIVPGRSRSRGFALPRGQVPQGPDPTDPAPQITTPGATLTTSTLGSVLADLNARRGDAAEMVVDDTLAAKPVMVFGERAVPPGQILDALAEVYGLRVRAQEDGKLRLTRRLFKMAVKITDLPEALRQVFPEPLLRAFHSSALAQLDAEERENAARRYQPKMQSAAEETNTRTIEEPSAEVERMRERFKSRDRLRGLPRQIRIAAAQRLRTLLEPKVKLSPDSRMPLSSLSHEERMGLAVLLMADAWEGLRLLISLPTPEWITNFNNLYLVGGLTEDKGVQTFSLFLATPALDGANVNIDGPGVAAVPYRKPQR